MLQWMLTALWVPLTLFFVWLFVDREIDLITFIVMRLPTLTLTKIQASMLGFGQPLLPHRRRETDVKQPLSYMPCKCGIFMHTIMLHMQFVHMLSPDYDHQLWFANATGGVCWFVILLSLRQIEYVKVRWKKPPDKWFLWVMFWVNMIILDLDITVSLNVNLLMMAGAQLFQLLQEILHLMTKRGEELLKFEQDAPARLSRNPVPLFIGFMLCFMIESETHCHKTVNMVQQGLDFSISQLTPQKRKKDIDFFQLFGIKEPTPTCFDDPGPTPDFSVDQMFMSDDFFCQTVGTFPQPMACLTESEMMDKFKETATRGTQALPNTGDKLQAIVDSGASMTCIGNRN